MTTQASILKLTQKINDASEYVSVQLKYTNEESSTNQSLIRAHERHNTRNEEYRKLNAIQARLETEIEFLKKIQSKLSL